MRTHTRNSTSITDLNLSFEINSNTGDLNKLQTDAVIRRSLDTILTTGMMEKPFREDFGSDVAIRLFEVAGSRDIPAIRSQIRNSIEKNEPRIKLIDLVIKFNPNHHRLELTISYMIKKTSEIDEIQTMLSLSEQWGI